MISEFHLLNSKCYLISVVLHETRPIIFDCNQNANICLYLENNNRHFSLFLFSDVTDQTSNWIVINFCPSDVIFQKAGMQIIPFESVWKSDSPMNRQLFVKIITVTITTLTTMSKDYGITNIRCSFSCWKYTCGGQKKNTQEKHMRHVTTHCIRQQNTVACAWGYLSRPYLCDFIVCLLP